MNKRFLLLIAALVLLMLFVACNAGRWASDSDSPAGAKMSLTTPADTTVTKPPNEQPTDTPEIAVVIDPGHGGGDPGCVADGVYEKDINLSIALKLRDLLEAENIGCVLTRADDRAVSSETRNEITNTSGAKMFISLHCNAYPEDTDVRGLEAHHHPLSPEGAVLAGYIGDAAAEAAGAKRRSDKASELKVLTYAQIPATLLEMGFMTCPEELRNLCDGAYQEKLARGILDGIIAYLNDR